MAERSDPTMVRALLTVLAMSPVAARAQSAAAPAVPPPSASAPADQTEDPATVRANALRSILETNIHGQNLRLYWETRNDQDDYFVDRIKGKADASDVLAYRKKLVAWGNSIFEMASNGVEKVSDENVASLQLKGDLLQQEFLELAPSLDGSAFAQTTMSTEHQFEALIVAIQIAIPYPRERTGALDKIIIDGLKLGIDHDVKFGRNLSEELMRLQHEQQPQPNLPFGLPRPAQTLDRAVKL